MGVKLLGKPVFWMAVLLHSYSLQLASETLVPSDADRSLTQRSITEYLDQLDQLEEQYGAYEPELGEELASLGNLYQANGQHQEAVAAFKRQYQIARTNDGLYSLSQAETLKKMITSLVALREWDEVENRHFFLQQLMARNYAQNDMRKVASLQDMANWHLYAYSSKIDEKKMLHLLTARNALAQTGSILSANSSAGTSKLKETYNTLLYTDYQIALVEQESAVQAQSRAAFEQRVRNDFYTNNRANEVSENLRTAQNSFLYGVRHLEDLRNAYANDPSAPAGSAANVDARIGDWYSLWQKHNTANRYYSKAWNALATDPAATTALQETFGKPVRLLNFVDKYEVSLPAKPGMKKGYVLFNISVNAAGRVKNLNILENEPAEKTREINRASQRMTRSRYRPRYENGEPVDSENIQVRYVFEYKSDTKVE